MNRERFDRARNAPDHGVLVHLICNEADRLFYSDAPGTLTEAHLTVLSVETFFSAVCDGGLSAWFDADHGQLAPQAPAALRRLGLASYADVAAAALRCHHDGEEPPATLPGWDPHLDRIRTRHGEEDCSELYASLEAQFFALLQEHPHEFRERLYAYIVEHEEELLAAGAAA